MFINYTTFHINLAYWFDRLMYTWTNRMRLTVTRVPCLIKRNSKFYDSKIDRRSSQGGSYSRYYSRKITVAARAFSTRTIVAAAKLFSDNDRHSLGEVHLFQVRTLIARDARFPRMHILSRRQIYCRHGYPAAPASSSILLFLFCVSGESCPFNCHCHAARQPDASRYIIKLFDDE